MIRRITLDNFMSHAHTVIEPADGLTVITGPNNCGKSAVVEALRMVCDGGRGTEYAIRHNAKEAAITVETDDGHTVIWRRKPKSTSYTVDGVRNDRPTPEFVDQVRSLLRLQFVKAADNGDPFHIHFGMQKSPIFLLNESETRQATFFASSSDADKLLAMQKLHRNAVLDDKRTEARLNGELAVVDERLKTLQPLDELKVEGENLAAEHTRCVKQAGEIDRASALLARWKRAQADQRFYEAERAAMAELAAPPKLQDERPLQTAASRLRSIGQQRAEARAKHESLGTLTLPPKLADVKSVADVIVRLRIAANQQRHASAVAVSLSTIAAPPPQHDLARITANIGELKRATRHCDRVRAIARAMESLAAPGKPAEVSMLQIVQIGLKTALLNFERCRRTSAMAAKQLADGREQTRRWIEANPTCPTCNGPLNADQLLATGAHSHGGDTHA